MSSEYVVFVQDGPHYSIESGLVHITDTSGERQFHRVIPVHAFKLAVRRAQRALAEWEAGQSEPIPFKRAEHQAAS